MMFLALVIYFALLMASYFINSTTLYGEMLFEKQASVAVYLALAVLAAFIGVRQYRLTPV